MATITRHDGRSGTFAGVRFDQGTGEADSPGHLRYFRSHPDVFEVDDTEPDPVPADATPSTPEPSPEASPSPSDGADEPEDDSTLSDSTDKTPDAATVADGDPEPVHDDDTNDAGDTEQAEAVEDGPYSGMERQQLMHLARERGLSDSGSASRIRERLARADAKSSSE